MNKIYKYSVPVGGEFNILLPVNSKILCVQQQHFQLAMWAIVDVYTEEFERRKFQIYGTGHEIDMDAVKQYIGTVQQADGNLVWHLFELK